MVTIHDRRINEASARVTLVPLCDEEAMGHPLIERERKHRWHSCGGNNCVPIRVLDGGKSCAGFEFANIACSSFRNRSLTFAAINNDLSMSLAKARTRLTRKVVYPNS